MDMSVTQPIKRQFQPNGPAHLDDMQLMETYRQMAFNPIYEDYLRNGYMRRYEMLKQKFARQPKGF